MHARANRMRRTTGGRRLAAAVALSAAALALACGKRAEPSHDALNDDLRHDLELASSAGIELAGAPKTSSLQVVSAVEQSDGAVPVRATRTHAPKATGKRRHAPTPKPREPAPAPAPEQAEAATVVAAAGPAPEQPAPDTAQHTPEPAAAPAPIVIDGGGSPGRGQRGPDVGTVIGTVLGVVIRGAMVGGTDPCDERVGHGRNGGITEMPLPIPGGGGGGFPRGGGFPHY